MRIPKNGKFHLPLYVYYEQFKNNLVQFLHHSLKMANSLTYPLFRDLSDKTFSLEITIGETVASVKQRLELVTQRTILSPVLFGSTLEDDEKVNPTWREVSAVHIVYPRVVRT